VQGEGVSGSDSGGSGNDRSDCDVIPIMVVVVVIKQYFMMMIVSLVVIVVVVIMYGSTFASLTCD